MSVVNTTTSVVVPAAVDWIALSKTLAIEAVFLASSVSAIFFGGGSTALNLAFATGATLGVLRIGESVSNAFNVHAVVNSPVAQKANILPQSPGTSLTTITPSNGETHA